jgi:hypothetical protein
MFTSQSGVNGMPAVQPILPDEDKAYTLLADLKRVGQEYAVAAMEAACPVTRKMFIQLLNNTIRMQGELFSAMQEQNMYNVSSPAPLEHIDKQLKYYHQTQSKTWHFVSACRQSQPSVQHPNQQTEAGTEGFVQ